MDHIGQSHAIALRLRYQTLGAHGSKINAQHITGSDDCPPTPAAVLPLCPPENQPTFGHNPPFSALVPKISAAVATPEPAGNGRMLS
jgi:hypothetical protein